MHIGRGQLSAVARTLGAPLPWRQMLSTAACAVFIVAALGAAPSPANAQMRRCAKHALTATDQRRMLAVAQATVPPGAVLESPGVCRNPGHASAWLSTTHQKSGDTVVRWYTLICDRDQTSWTCEGPELHQQVERDVTIADHPLRLSIDFDQATSRDDAIHFATQALSIAIAPATSLAECDYPKAGEAEWRAARPAVQSLIASPQHVTVSTEKGTVAVVLFGDFGLRFQLPTADRTDLPAPCWEQWIIVT